ncbi:interphotoreceptor matrix proteoglycan 2-like [Cololabis saira]|uniref:interphotoreceptor matrix proteoglycan 2-like n=1 Tax=Cololabis saira TaxID=129043 RepID=UPI002AD3AD43|nr:interphotoreceptor matrix proteoglycan 2-like [Cololabis saira]
MDGSLPETEVEDKPEQGDSTVEIPPETTEGDTEPEDKTSEYVPEDEDQSETSPELVVEEFPTEKPDAPVEDDGVQAGGVEDVVAEAAGEGTQEPLEVTKEPLEVTKEPLEVTKEPLEVTKEPLEVTKEPLEVTKEPLEETEEPTQGSDLEVTTKYVEETNNGNFPHEVEDDDNLLGNNGFLLEDDEQNSIGNEIGETLVRPSRPLKDQVVELRLKLREESYNDALRDPSSLEFQLLDRTFKRRIEDAFERLPGFKNVYVIEFRPQKDLERGLVVQVHYAITLEVEADASVANDTLDFITLQNNLVEKNYPAAAETPTVIYTITDFRNYITEALHKDMDHFLSNSSLDNAAENVLPSAKPTSRPDDEYNNMDNILAAEKPPDAPSHEADTNVFMKEDFLSDAFDQWKVPQSDTMSENDVFMFDESTASPPDTNFPKKSLELELTDKDGEERLSGRKSGGTVDVRGLNPSEGITQQLNCG